MTQILTPIRSYNPCPPRRCDIPGADLQDAAMALQVVRRLSRQYAAEDYPIMANQLKAIHESLRDCCPRASVSLLAEPIVPRNHGPEKATGTSGTRRCSVCAHQARNEIDSALRAGASLRAVAAQFLLRKSTVARHRRHMSHEQP